MTIFVTSGEWIVKPGQDEEFFEAWTTAKDPDPPMRGVVTPPRLLLTSKRHDAS